MQSRWLLGWILVQNRGRVGRASADSFPGHELGRGQSLNKHKGRSLWPAPIALLPFSAELCPLRSGKERASTNSHWRIHHGAIDCNCTFARPEHSLGPSDFAFIGAKTCADRANLARMDREFSAESEIARIARVIPYAVWIIDRGRYAIKWWHSSC
ncbi:hypothetical protein XH94_13255 [Bradyrhizobium zhanjiangense]|uniref:Uncharacterized protein n=1 Tax=Bradyrhizobium zhanjiangense TaxID=1325107 RepID=A0A4V1L467_9BRAD|nr:hypothetical protein XH94_13255 [Bradyrhizobium zhanjiangense]